MRRTTSTGIRNTKPAPAPMRLAPARRRPLARWALPLGVLLGAAAVGLAVVWYFHRGGPSLEGMVLLPGGEFEMGDDSGTFEDTRPVHPVHVDGFYIDKYPVTNAEFARFVAATGYKTVSERTPRPEDFPELPQDQRPRSEDLVAGSMVFFPNQAVDIRSCCQTPGAWRQWWQYRPGASWKHPDGPGSHTVGKDDHPVVHICWEDAQAYAAWAGKRLPTEAEFEYAARGGLARQPYAWGGELTPDGKWMANIWQGEFPGQNSKEDRYLATSPVGSFPPNGFGLSDMAGNVWQWCSDWYRPGYDAAGPRRNPQGPESSEDPCGSPTPQRVQRGGSFLCSDLYCVKYRVGARGHGDPKTGMSHTGFRCVWSPK